MHGVSPRRIGDTARLGRPLTVSVEPEPRPRPPVPSFGPDRRAILAAVLAAGGVAIGTAVAAPHTTDSPAVVVEPTIPPGLFSTADFGCVANDDDPATALANTVGLQSAIDAAAAVGGTVAIQAGVLHLDGDPIRLPYGRVSLLGLGRIAMLSWEKATALAEGAVVVGVTPETSEEALASGLGPPGGAGWCHIDSVQFRGPIGDTALDGVELSAPISRPESSKWVFTNCVWIGFRVQEILGDGAYLVRHNECIYFSAGQAAIDFVGAVNSGEGMNWTGCIFADVKAEGSTILRANTVSPVSERDEDVVGSMYLDAFFTGCSFDYSQRVLVAQYGTWMFTDCHFESSFAGPWFSLSCRRIAQRRSRRTVLVFQGGQVMPHSAAGVPTPTTYTVMSIDDDVTEETTSNRPTTIVVDAAHMISGDSAESNIRWLDASRAPAGVEPQVRAVGAVIGGWDRSNRVETLGNAWGPAFSVLRNSGFDEEENLWDIADPGRPNLLYGWCLAQSERAKWLSVRTDTDTRLYGARSMRFDAAAGTRALMLEQFARVDGGRQLTVAITDRMGAATGSYDVTVQQFDAAGSALSVPSLAGDRIVETDLETIRFEQPLDPTTDTWRTRGGGMMLDRATSFVRIRLVGDFVGTLWLDDVEAVQPL